MYECLNAQHQLKSLFFDFYKTIWLQELHVRHITQRQHLIVKVLAYSCLDFSGKRYFSYLVRRHKLTIQDRNVSILLHQLMIIFLKSLRKLAHAINIDFLSTVIKIENYQ